MKMRVANLWGLLLICATCAHAQNQRDTAVREDKQKLADDKSWFYDNLEAARSEAARSKRPMMIVFR